MALTGIEIYKLLPRTNCGKCGVPTCLAFAMQLAAGKSNLNACPDISDETKAILTEASAPPIRLISLPTGWGTVNIGGETVSFRHEKRFENPPPLAVLISDTAPESEIEQKIWKLNSLVYERVGFTLRPELAAIKADSSRSDQFAALVGSVKQQSPAGLILMSSDPDILTAGIQAAEERKPLLYAVTPDNEKSLTELARKFNCPLVVKGKDLEETVSLVDRLRQSGFQDLVIDSGARTLKQSFHDQVRIRQAALGKVRSLGFPTIVFPAEMTDDHLKEALLASVFIAKYGAIIVLSDFHPHSLFPMLVQRMNIYSDPQKPLSTKEGIYEIGKPDKYSPVLITSNFSLTYFIVSGEIENSKISAYLIVKDTEGLSVMTAWAAGKFNADIIASFVTKCGIADKISHRRLILPGYLAQEKASLEEELPGWKIDIGPREASHIPAYLKSWKPE